MARVTEEEVAELGWEQAAWLQSLPNTLFCWVGRRA